MASAAVAAAQLRGFSFFSFSSVVAVVVELERTDQGGSWKFDLSADGREMIELSYADCRRWKADFSEDVETFLAESVGAEVPAVGVEMLVGTSVAKEP